MAQMKVTSIAIRQFNIDWAIESLNTKKDALRSDIKVFGEVYATMISVKMRLKFFVVRWDMMEQL